MINKSASFAGTVEWTNGNRTALYVGGNSNTGDTIVWQKVGGRRATRLTGRNLPAFLAELDECFSEGECEWADDHNAVVFDALVAAVRS